MGYSTPHPAVRTRFCPVLPLDSRRTPSITSKRKHGWLPAPDACPRLASRHGVRRACRRGDGSRKRNDGPVQAPDRLRADERLHLSRDQLFGAPAGGRGLSASGGGLPLPDFTNWHAGLTFSYRVFKLGLNYTDTNLSRENCYVLTGDVAAAPGGISNPGDNPFGLRSALCGATFSATLGVEINPATFGR